MSIRPFVRRHAYVIDYPSCGPSSQAVDEVAFGLHVRTSVGAGSSVAGNRDAFAAATPALHPERRRGRTPQTRRARRSGTHRQDADAARFRKVP